jgi:2,3-bisphosphoglycerate-independent phosphoglycerate mutase
VPRILFLFLDGVGIGPATPELNPFLRARLPVLRELLGGIPTLESPTLSGASGRARSFPLDATLDTEGTPQSGTGQIALLTGLNAARLHGHHFGPWPPVKLRPLLDEENLLRRARRLGHSVVFANAYPSDFPGARNPRLLAAPPLAAAAAGVLDRHGPALVAGRAVASEIENTLWQRYWKDAGIPDVTAEAAGENLGRIAGEAELTVFAHYATDDAGHGGRGRTKKDPAERMVRGIAALERVDRFLGGLLRTLDPTTLLLVASDHGNIEDVSGEHTRNPALGLMVGDGCGGFPALGGIMDVPEGVLGWLSSVRRAEQGCSAG